MADPTDPHGVYRNNRFLVEVDGLTAAGFSRVQLPAASSAVVEYREGNARRPTPTKLSGSMAYDPLVLERAVTESRELYDWFAQAESGDVEGARRNVAVVLLDESGESGPRWTFTDAWPARYSPPALDAGTNEPALETLELVHEGMERE